MADKGGNMADNNGQNSLFHDLGQHLADAYQKFLDARTEYGKTLAQSPDESLNNAQSDTVTGEGAKPITPETEQQLQRDSIPYSEPQVLPIQNASQTQGLTSVPNSIPSQQSTQPTPDTSQGQQGLPGPLAAQANLVKETGNVQKGIEDTYNTGLAQQNDLMNATQQHFQENLAQDRALADAYATRKIDPNAVINNMTTGGKIMTSLGLLFSGLGSGLTGQKNLAMEVINNAISRDLEAQKANAGIAYNAYQMHREGTHDEYTADLQHQKDNMLAIDAAIEAQKAKLMTPQAVANATQTQLQLRGQIFNLNKEQAMWNATQEALKNSNMDPASRLRALQLTGQLSPQQAEQANKELDRVQNLNTQRQNILESFDKANQENTVAGRITHLGSTPASVYALQNQIMPYLKDAEGRINETEIKRTDELIPKPGDGPHKIAEKRKALIDFMNEKSSSSTLRGLGLNQQPQQQPQYKTVNGVKYMRGPNGEAIKVQ